MSKQRIRKEVEIEIIQKLEEHEIANYDYEITRILITWMRRGWENKKERQR